MKYHNHELIKVIDEDIDGGKYYKIYRRGEFIAIAWTLSNAKEFVDTFDGEKYSYNVLC